MNEAEAIVADFIAKGWDSNPYQRMMALALGERGSVLKLVQAALNDLPRGSTFFDAALSFLTEDEFSELIDDAIRRLEAGSESKAASSVIAYGSLQVPHLLTRHLLSCWKLRPNQGAYYETWPWGGADGTEVARLLDMAKSNGDDAERAWRCLLQTRRPSVVTEAARALAGGVDFHDWLKHVGFTQEAESLVPLHPLSVWHIRFPEGFLDDSRRPPWSSKAFHPTWSFEPVNTPLTIVFGGRAEATCPFCHGPLHRLFDLAQQATAGKTQPPTPLSIATCLSCLGWEQDVLFYKHDLAGLAQGLNPLQKEAEPKFPSGPLRFTRAHLVELPKRWQVQDWALSNSRENLNRIGGMPTWIQDAAYPECLVCTKTMSFLAQLDSDLPTEDGGEWLWGSGGLCYIFWCDGCRVSALLWQCT